MTSPNIKAKFWKPTPASETSRLSASSGWNLPGSLVVSSRTRRAFAQDATSAVLNGGSSSHTLFTTPSSVTVDAPSLPEVPPLSGARRQKPPHSKIILEVTMLKNAMEQFLGPCSLCNAGALKVTFPTCCIASGVRLACDNQWCNFVHVKRPASAEVPLGNDAGSALIERSTDYAINILFVLGFLSSGDGGQEASRVLGLLGLPNSTTFGKRSFTIIESRLSPVLKELADEILHENLCKEVQIYYSKTYDNEQATTLFDRWKAKDPTLPTNFWPRITCSTDMGWQKRASGRLYSSLSGHSCFVTSETRKPITRIVKSKACRLCTMHRKFGNEPPEHECTINHDGHSGAMEPDAVLEMFIDLYTNKHVVVERLIADDDSSVRSKLRWNNEDYMTNNNIVDFPTYVNRNGNISRRPNTGGVPGHMPEPKWINDPNHRKKTLKGELYGLCAKTVDIKKGVTKSDCMRISTNFAYMMRTLPGKDPNQFVDAAKAVLEHHFDNHHYCGDFCRRKNETPAQRQASNKFYRCKVKDQELHVVLSEVLARFITLEALLQVGHGMDTLVNEALNNIIAWVAPKNKTYGTSQSLTNRICLAIGINGVGTFVYFERLFAKLSIEMTPDVRYYIHQVNDIRQKRIDLSKETKTKRKRQTKFYKLLEQHIETAKKERCKREGSVYQPGIGFNADCNGDNQQAPKRRKTSQKKDMSNVKCRHCKDFGHAVRTNKKCKHNKKNPEYDATYDGDKVRAAATAAATAPVGTSTEEEDNATSAAEAVIAPSTDDDVDDDNADAAECELMDQFGFESDGDDEFFDALDEADDLED